MRTPKVLVACDDESVIGAPFYVMERVERRRDRDRAARARSTPRRTAAASARSSSTRWSRSTPSTGRPAASRATASRRGYLDRQLRRFGGLWEHNKTRELPVLDDVTRVAGRAQAGVRPGHDRPRRLPARQRDVRPGTPARLNAIFDWELATIGDPLADVGYLVATWAQPGDPENAISALGGLTRAARLPDAATELIARYEERSGRSMSDVRWYMTLALWKSAIFLEGSYKRRLAGTTEDPFFDLLEQGVPDVAERAWGIAQGRSA